MVENRWGYSHAPFTDELYDKQNAWMLEHYIHCLNSNLFKVERALGTACYCLINFYRVPSVFQNSVLDASSIFWPCVKKRETFWKGSGQIRREATYIRGLKLYWAINSRSQEANFSGCACMVGKAALPLARSGSGANYCHLILQATSKIYYNSRKVFKELHFAYTVFSEPQMQLRFKPPSCLVFTHYCTSYIAG